jgi:hypothetical protein
VNGSMGYGWPKWTPGNGTNAWVELGVGNKSAPVLVSSDSFVGMCPGLGYNVGP